MTTGTFLLRERLSRLLRNRKAATGLAILGFFAAVGLLAPVLASGDPLAMAYAPVEPPSLRHPLGTTALGQDILSQVIWGIRLSLLVGMVTAVVTLLSTVVGLSAGYFGGLVDDILSTVTNIFSVLPGLPLMIVVAAYVKVKGIVPIVLVISATGWAWRARLLRAR